MPDDKKAAPDPLGQIAKVAKAELGAAQARVFEKFATQYFLNVPPQDLDEQTPERLFALAHAQWDSAAKRRPRGPLIRVFNPDLKKDGWESDHTILEVVTDDMPFLVDSITGALARRGLTVHLVIHPIIKVKRTEKGELAGMVGPGEPEKGLVLEAWMHFQIDAQARSVFKEIKQEVGQILADVRASVEDWRPMLERMSQLIDELATPPAGQYIDDVMEVREFLRWIFDNNFTFLGYREYKISGSGQATKVSVAGTAGLGLLRQADVPVFEPGGDLSAASNAVRQFLSLPDQILITKTNDRTRVHRTVHMDAIGVKRYDSNGKVVGLRVFAGLFTSAAYNRSPRDIPLLRRRIQRVIASAGLPPASHDGKALLNILETHPRDELFQVSSEQLHSAARGILHLQERQRVALFVRRDAFERYMSCLIYVPRDRYTMALRRRMQAILCDAFKGSVVTFSAQLGDAPLARLHLIIATRGPVPGYEVADLEQKLAETARSWSDRLREVLVSTHGEQRGLELQRKYGEAFGAGYSETYDPGEALSDITILEGLMETREIGLKLHSPKARDGSAVRFKVFHADRAIALSDIMPMFEHMGFRVLEENPHRLEVAMEDGAVCVFMQDFVLEPPADQTVDIAAIAENFEDAFRRVWRGEIESDGFNTLVAFGGLTWRQVVILRAYCKCLKQMGLPFSQSYIEQTLVKHIGLTRMLIELFEARFDPRPAAAKGKKAGKGAAKSDDARQKHAAGLVEQITAGLEDVVSADEDRIISRFLLLMEKTLRTNFYQKGDSAGKAYKPRVSFKFASREIDGLPLPRPYREIFVYSPRIEGVHLRFGAVARGGLRWSDRLEDFRTEVLGLVKAQQVKNAVIVPVGSKGGFVVKRPPADGGREAFMAEGVACYKEFISGLLDITDNLKGNRVKPPKDVVRWDDDDPYLVVAADKGTATFSDIANGVSGTYGFWLGDAFASGGSQGYDHKGMGITAKGAWESVKRHFREIGLDTQTQDFTAVGVGDMSGDVFGNGMLLSEHIRLIGAFNHLHIFIDPDPDAAKTFKERKRLFDMGRSSWTDYDRKLISKGGGIFERSAKNIDLTPEIKELYGLKADRVTPNELLQAMLSADVDLLWFGGIGTYIKATSEAHADVGDRANDAIRVNGNELRCKVVGEGANLGATQRGRIEFALEGGRLNTDSIDNSAGVDCSDHEVNIKILVDAAVDAGRLSEKQRNDLLAKMTAEVSDLVLIHNYHQTQAISVIQARGVTALDNQSRLMRFLERENRLDRAVEYLPDDETLAERATSKHGLVRPEISVLISYAKNWLYDVVLASTIPDDPHLRGELVTYFPTPLRSTYQAEIDGHKLRREIIATRVTNNLINRTGETFVTEMAEKTGLEVADIVRAATIAREVLGLDALWEKIEALDTKVPSRAQTSMLTDINHLLEWVTLWFLRNGDADLELGSHIERFKPGMAELAQAIPAVVPKHYITDMKSRAAPYLKDKVPEVLAHEVAHLVNLYSGCDIVQLATAKKMAVDWVAKVYFVVSTRFRLGRLRRAASMLDSGSHWQNLAIDALVEEIYAHHLALASCVLSHAGKATDPNAALAAWIEKNKVAVQQTDVLLADLWTTDVNDLSMIAVASRQLRQLADSQK